VKLAIIGVLHANYWGGVSWLDVSPRPKYRAARTPRAQRSRRLCKSRNLLSRTRTNMHAILYVINEAKNMKLLHLKQKTVNNYFWSSS